MSEPTAGAETGTPEAARAHSRAMGGTVVEHMPTLPATRYNAPGDLEAASLVWAERVAPGGYTHRVIAAGTTLRLTDLEGDACAHLLLYRGAEPFERLNVADTIKVQWQAYLEAGMLLLSDQGRALATLVADTSGYHDTMAGASSVRRNEERYGAGSPESLSPAGRALLGLAGLKHGLGARDLPVSLSFFKGVAVDPTSGALSWRGAAPAGSFVELKAEFDLIVLLANTAHPVDPRPEWSCSTLEVLAWPGTPTMLDDPMAVATPERQRAFLNNDEDRSARGKSRLWTTEEVPS